MKTRPIGIVASLNQFSRRGKLRTPEGSYSFRTSNRHFTYRQIRIKVSQLRVLREGGAARFRVREMMEDDQILQIIEESQRQNPDDRVVSGITQPTDAEERIEHVEAKLIGTVRINFGANRDGFLVTPEKSILRVHFSKVGNLFDEEGNLLATREDLVLERNGSRIPFTRGLKKSDKVYHMVEVEVVPAKLPIKFGNRRFWDLPPLPQREAYNRPQGSVVVAQREGRISRWL